MLIIARTDARQTYGFDEAHQRLKDAADIGVDIVFFEALQSREECRLICELMGHVPVLLNSVPGGVTPDLNVEEAKTLGFRIVIFPALCIGPVVNSIKTELLHLKAYGTASYAGKAVHIKEAFDLCGLQECIDVDKKAGGKAYSSMQQNQHGR